MMALNRWNPTADLMSLHSEMDRLFNEAVQGGGAAQHAPRWSGEAPPAYAPIDVYRTQDAVVVEASVPGFSPEEVSVSFEGDVLTIEAERRQPGAPQDGRRYLRQERYPGPLYRQVALGSDLDGEAARASFANGVLTVRVPMVPKPQPRRIPVTRPEGG
jgi:HSP20 family protein